MALNPIGRRKVQIIAHATEAMDGQSNMLAWVQKPSQSFGGRTPFDVLNHADPDKLQRLDDILTALDHGMRI